MQQKTKKNLKQHCISLDKIEHNQCNHFSAIVFLIEITSNHWVNMTGGSLIVLL